MGQHRLTRELALLAREACEAPPQEIDCALERLLSALCSALGASNAYWVGALRAPDPHATDPLRGWRAREVVFLHDHPRRVRAAASIAERIHAGEVDPSTVAVVRRAGRTRAHLRPELVPNPEWERSWLFNEFHRQHGVHDQLIGAVAISPRHESYLGLQRGRGDRPFGVAERDLLRLLLELTRAFHRRLLTYHGLAGERPLTGREREVLRRLVTDATEKEIGAELRIGARTVHQHALAIYEKLGVRGRVGLLARLLAGAGTEGRVSPAH